VDVSSIRWSDMSFIRDA
jgi:hypothetical protein